MYPINTPVSIESIEECKIGDELMISGFILCGRDAVLPKIVRMIQEGTIEELGVDLEGSVIFHTAVSPAGVGPTSSNKLEIESSISALSQAGVRIHLGKGKISEETIKALEENDSVYAVIPPVTALLKSKTISQRVVAFEEEGMEAMHLLEVSEFPAIVAAAHGKSIYDEEQ